MSNSHNAGSGSRSSGCFSGIVRLILCKGSHQTHPSDQIPEPITTELFNHVKKDSRMGGANVEAPVCTAPGVVARLMGLESLPDTNWVPKGRGTPDSVTRSRSVNFMDYLLQLDLAQAQHRRVRTSVSFREVPALINQENHDVYVLYLDDHAEKCKKLGSKQRKSEGINLGDQMKQKNDDQSKNKESIITREGAVTKTDKNRQNNSMKVSTSKNELKREPHNRQSSRFGSCKGAQVSSGFVMPHKKDVHRKSRENSKARSSAKKSINQKEVLVESKFMKRMKNRQVNKESQSDCSSDDSSTISLLGLNEFLAHDAIPLPAGDTWAVDFKCSKKTSSPNPPNLTNNMLINNGEVEPRGIKKHEYESCNNHDKEHYTEIARKLCRLTEEDIKDSRWARKNMKSNVKGIRRLQDTEVCVCNTHMACDICRTEGSWNHVVYSGACWIKMHILGKGKHVECGKFDIGN
ncbi:unnamed protein product [Dovyalis caffra]|uniref:DUF3741 domain-containing protein n=1 Tax=Dovyalis caffra TaxID=77055 RepID=A0AAV1S3K1_9ROSI|nr:unnamed protein product [Dovyalis caffra]